jgi:Leucine-rich repeat (LRR) protein
MVIFSEVLIFILFIGLNQNTSAQGLEQDSLALVDLYDSTDGINWTNNTNWLTDQPLSAWYGISVSSGRVTEVKLDSNNIAGSIPSSIGDLDGLNNLSLQWNQLAGSIPMEIGNLTIVQELKLRGNQLTGSIPNEIGNLINLRCLILSENRLTDAIPTEIGNLTNLMQLWLNQNQLKGPIPAEIGNLTNLEDLNLNGNLLSGSIPHEIGNLTNLRHLHASANQLTGAIPAEIGNLKNLLALSLMENQLTGSIPPEIGNLTNLTHQLSIKGNQLSGPIPVEIGNLTNLQNLNLNGNQLTGSIPPEIGNLTNLRQLELIGNQLTDSIPSVIGNLMNLQYLYLWGNQLKGAVPNSITNLTKLERLYLGDNRLMDLPDLSPIDSLKDLRIDDNQFTFEDLEPNIGVPDSIFLYSPQDSVGVEQDTTVNAGSCLTVSVFVGGANNQYQWTKEGVDIPGADSSSYLINPVVLSDSGSYVCRITNTVATELTLYSRPNHVTVIGGEGITDRSTLIPKVLVLHQNYPNPFNPSTRISYSIPHSGFVSLKIYDILGREIRILVSEFQNAGNYSFNFDAGKLSSGVYFYRLQAGSDCAKIKKMLLIG